MDLVVIEFAEGNDWDTQNLSILIFWVSLLTNESLASNWSFGGSIPWGRMWRLVLIPNPNQIIGNLISPQSWIVDFRKERNMWYYRSNLGVTEFSKRSCTRLRKVDLATKTFWQLSLFFSYLSVILTMTASLGRFVWRKTFHLCWILNFLMFYSSFECISYLCVLKPLGCHFFCRQIFPRDVIGSHVVSIALWSHFEDVVFVYRIEDSFQ